MCGSLCVHVFAGVFQMDGSDTRFDSVNVAVNAGGVGSDIYVHEDDKVPSDVDVDTHGYGDE